ncbi:glycogen/starch/alpha-glucan family phosphorylase [bacterium]|nr:glycogen/starch/alpha-glucan family phosphorylase [bacterium]
MAGSLKENTDTQIDDLRTGVTVSALRRALADNLYYAIGKYPEIATKNDFYLAVAHTVRDRLLNKWINTIHNYFSGDHRVVCYLSAEFLLGPHLENNLINLGFHHEMEEALKEAGLKLEDIVELEEEPGLGNGGLGRLAACYLDSMASLNIPSIGFGIRYEFGIFDQEIKDGWQVEIADRWLRYGNPWELARPEAAFSVKFGGSTESYKDENGNYRVRWKADREVRGIPYDTPIAGFKNNTANTLRLWRAEAPDTFDFQVFNMGDYLGAVTDKMMSENISKVLYPNDNVSQGRQLRLEQQYFFVSCSLQNIIQFQHLVNDRVENLHKRFVIQLNDTHPSIAIPELMRLLIDEHGLDWNTAWHVTSNCFAYTNHTLLPEALEKWPVSLMESLLPRHMQIIYEINQRFLDKIKNRPQMTEEVISRLSLIDESGGKFVRMANLACVGSSRINGVAELHTELLKSNVLNDFYKLNPEKFVNITNGVTPRRWIAQSNPELTELISSVIGDSWINDLKQLKKLEPLARDKVFQKKWQAVKLKKKTQFAEIVKKKTGVEIDPESIYDIQVKRMHEYKRQHLNVLHIITLYNHLKENKPKDFQPRTFMFGGKAAPGYFMAKLMIKLITSVADVVNNDPEVNHLMKIVFLPDFNVSLAQKVYPAADLSEQISTAGKEASGTGNMKFALNGALTIGTMDGANIEIREEVGEDNFFLFGLRADEVQELKDAGYTPRKYYDENPKLKQVLDQIRDGVFSDGDRQLFEPLVHSLLEDDPFLLLADYQSYIDCQMEVGRAYMNREHWTEMSILNVARMGKFSSDRSIEEYCAKIWHVEPVAAASSTECKLQKELKVR